MAEAASSVFAAPSPPPVLLRGSKRHIWPFLGHPLLPWDASLSHALWDAGSQAPTHDYIANVLSPAMMPSDGLCVPDRLPPKLELV